MSAVRDDELVVRIESIVSATPGVSGVFRSGSAFGRVADTAARALGLREGNESLVVLTRDDDAVSIDVSIGVSAGFGARETVRRVHDAIATQFRHDGDGRANVRVTVVHIDDAAPAGPKPSTPAGDRNAHD